MDVAEEVPVLSGKSDADMDLALAALADDTRSHDVLSFSNQELKILELYDELKEIELEKAVARAQLAKANDPSPSVDTDSAVLQIKQAQNDLLDARATYTLRESVVENVIEADPILKAVHAGVNATATERALHPAIDERDLLAMSQANLSATFQTIMNDTTMLQAENIKAMQHNRELAATVWDLAGELRTQDPESIDDIELRERLETLRREGKDSRRRFRMLKSLASGMVVGSGVDWAEDAKLRDIVLDSED